MKIETRLAVELKGIPWVLTCQVRAGNDFLTYHEKFDETPTAEQICVAVRNAEVAFTRLKDGHRH